MEVLFRVLAAGAPPAAELPCEQPGAVGFPAGHAMELGHQVRAGEFWDRELKEPALEWKLTSGRQ
eukprot:6100358-Alexandrium_andersonii.AAC.1